MIWIKILEVGIDKELELYVSKYAKYTGVK